MDIRSFFKKPRLDGINPLPSQGEPSFASTSVTSGSDLPMKSESPKQIVLKEYPKQKESNRSFRAAWYKQFQWLEYSVSKDAAFCYACMNFNRFGTKELAYTQNGFKNWKNALDTNRGFPKHDKSESHILAMKMWKEKDMRTSTNTSISTLVNDAVLEKHRYYIKSIIEVVQFLAVNQLSFRGDYDIEEHMEGGLFNKFFEYTLKKDKRLAECFLTIPKNATYHSPEIQNEIIAIMAEVVRESVAEDIKNADVPYFTLLEDGTKDKNNRENIAIAVRYVKNGEVNESLIDVITTKKLDALTFTETTLKVLDKYGIDKQNMLSQCYDGASVMSGVNNGVAALVQQKCGKVIPYVHCFNHRLHLVLVKTVSEIFVINQFFDQCTMIHNFFQHSKVAALYEGKTIVRLLEQRWSGHFQITNVILSNFAEIMRVLNVIKDDKSFDGEDVAKSIGIITVMASFEFRFSLVFCNKLLGLIKPADAILQIPKSSLRDGIEIIKTVSLEIKSLRSDERYQSIATVAEELLPSPKMETTTGNQQLGRGQRQRKEKTMKDFIITEKLPSSSPTLVLCKNICLSSELETMTLKPVYYETIDRVISEINNRFLEKEDLMQAISSVDEFDLSKLQYLCALGINMPSVEELTVVKSFVTKLRQEEQATAEEQEKKKDQEFQLEESQSSKSIESTTKRKWKSKKSNMELLYKYKDAFRATYELLAVVDTFGCSTATCESTFSTLTAINKPQRLSMTHQRMANLVFLAYEKRRTENINIDSVLQKFNKCKDRKLQLF